MNPNNLRESSRFASSADRAHSRTPTCRRGARRVVTLLLLLSMTIAYTPAAFAATVTIGINYGSGTGKTSTSFHNGLNAYQVFTPGILEANPDYYNNFTSMKPGIVRVHRAQQMKASTADGWLIYDSPTSARWDATKIARSLDQLPPGTKMINIANWPAYMDTNSNGKLDSTMYAAYADLCGDLVDIVNNQQGRGVKYWEVTNEKDDANGYYDAATGRNEMDLLGDAFNAASAEMRRRVAAGSIKVGGPAFISYKQAAVDKFLNRAIKNLDFVSYHTYPSGYGSDYKSDQAIFDAAANLGGTTGSYSARVTAAKDAAGATQTVELFHDEYNLSYTPYDPSRNLYGDPRQRSITGAIFDALAMTSIAKAGATGSMAWNESDFNYGKLNNNNSTEAPPFSKRPSAYLYQLYYQYLRGPIFNTSTTDAAKIVPFAVKQSPGDSRPAFMLINRSGFDQTVKVNFYGVQSIPAGFTTYRVSADGLTGPGYVSFASITSDTGYAVQANTIKILVAQY